MCQSSSAGEERPGLNSLGRMKARATISTAGVALCSRSRVGGSLHIQTSVKRGRYYDKRYSVDTCLSCH